MTNHPRNNNQTDRRPASFSNAGIYTSGPYAAHSQRLLEEVAQTRPANTLTAYEPKAKEFIDFCNEKYADRGAPYAELVSEEKVFAYLLYQAHRKKGKGGKGRNRKFDAVDFELVLRDFENGKVFNDVVGYDVLNQSLSSILKLWKYQSDMGANSLRKDEIRSTRVNELLNHVKTRKKRVKKARYDEKIDYALNPYLLAQQLPKLVQVIFEKFGNSLNLCGSTLTDRFMLLFT